MGKGKGMNIIKKEKKWIAVYLTFSLLLTAIRLINPLLVSRFFDNAGGSDIEYLLKIVLILLSASICGGFLNIFCAILDTKVRNRIVRKAKKEYLEKLLRLNYETLEKMDFGDRKTRYDFNEVYGELAVSFISNTIVELFTCAFIFIYLLTINRIMTAVFVVCLLVNSVLEFHIGKISYKFSKEVTEIVSEGESKVCNALKNIAYIKTNHCADIIVNNIDAHQLRLSRRQEQHTKEVVSIDNLNSQIYKLIEVIIFAAAAFMLKNNTISVGQIYLFINYMGWIDNAFSTIWDNHIKYKASKAKIDMIESTFENIGDINSESPCVVPKDRVSSLTVSDVGFQYHPGEFEICSLNMNLEKGDFVAIVGGSGCGKSTLMKLISGLYRPKTGKILYNGEDITTLSPESRSYMMAYVSQNIAIMDGRLYDIVDFLNTGVSKEAICHVLRLAGLSQFVSGLEDGLDTYISESGINLSGGQLQRLAVAQAMIYSKEVYLFDEITSGLDDLTQKQLIENLKSISDDKIMIFVTHRLNALGQFNKVFRIENGTMSQIR